MTWLGYKVHLTETCAIPEEAERTGMIPHLIVQVHTTVAPVPDVQMTAPIQAELVKAGHAPAEHIVDTGYVDADLLMSSQREGIKLLGPVLSDNSWQAKAGKGFDQAHFQIDWTTGQATCPQGQTSTCLGKAAERMEIVFAREVCAACPVHEDCTRSQTTGRVLHVRPKEAYEALATRREEQQTAAFRQAYATRSGIEGTLSQAVRGMGLRRAHYDGLAKVHLQHVLTAVTINLVRIDAVLTTTPRGKTRRTHFERLGSHPCLQGRAAA